MVSGDPGHPIAYGRTSEIYRCDQEHVLKLFYDWVELQSIENEARISRATYERGLPIPAVGEIVHVIERMGLIYQRVEGDSFYKAAQCKPWNIPRYCRRIAGLHVEIYPVYLRRYFRLCPGGEKEYRRWLPIVAVARLSPTFRNWKRC